MGDSSYIPIINIISDLRNRGFTHDFHVAKKKFFCEQKKRYYLPDDFDFVEMYSFHLPNHLNQDTIVFAVKSNSNKIKGVLVIKTTAKKN